MFSRFIPGPDEVSQASELVSTFLVHQFLGSDNYVIWE